MTLLPQLQAELVVAAQRPVFAKRVSLRVLGAVLAAILVLLIVTPPSVARRPGPTIAVIRPAAW